VGIFQYKHSVRGDIPVQNTQSIGTFQYKISVSKTSPVGVVVVRLGGDVDDVAVVVMTGDDVDDVVMLGDVVDDVVVMW
jgi:hypothetical protein